MLLNQIKNFQSKYDQMDQKLKKNEQDIELEREEMKDKLSYTCHKYESQISGLCEQIRASQVKHDELRRFAGFETDTAHKIRLNVQQELVESKNFNDKVR